MAGWREISAPSNFILQVEIFYLNRSSWKTSARGVYLDTNRLIRLLHEHALTTLSGRSLASPCFGIENGCDDRESRARDCQGQKTYSYFLC